jgi:Dyp-type peroxidase family
MQRDVIAKTRNLGGSSDLTLLAPIKPGFVESLESVTYKTRIKRVLETLHGARQTSHEYASARLLSDSVERVGAIHSVRVAVLEPENKVLLAVTFDGSRESYIRVLWDKVGTLLDLIFCGTVDYVTAFDHSFDEWMEWAQRVQVETGFFYGPPDFTARDVLYHRRIERMQLRGDAGPKPSTRPMQTNHIRAVSPSAEQSTRALLRLTPWQADDPQVIGPLPAITPSERMAAERIRNGLQGLAVLYRLADVHRPETEEGEILRRATVDMLMEFVDLWIGGRADEEIETARISRFQRQIDWLFPRNADNTANLAALNNRAYPTKADTLPSAIDDNVLADLQGGIVRAYPPAVSTGEVLLLAFSSPAVGASLMNWALKHVTRGDDKKTASSFDKPYCNIALTPEGLRALGMDEDCLALLPEDFRQGMAARCGLLGDVRNNHPQRWRLPTIGSQHVPMDIIHAVVQLRSQGTPPADPFKGFVTRLLKDNPGLQLLATQPLIRHYSSDQSKAEEHFGYSGGGGQPEVEVDPKGTDDDNRVHLGEIIYGHDNAADFAPNLADASLSESVRARMHWLANGSFLVMRKYRQFVNQLQAAVLQTAHEMSTAFPNDTGNHAETVYAKLMGRQRDGTPLVKDVTRLGYFDFEMDRQGQQCPLGAHIRLAHPRAQKTNGARPPRLMRRSMSYGPDYNQADSDKERGLLFMAYNASISEQYEVVQRWLSGGNSTGSSSARSCPFVGVPENGISRYFSFEYEGKVFQVKLEPDNPLFEEPKSLTRLEWGLYLFTPSITALGRLQDLALRSVKASHVPVPWEVNRGRELIAHIKEIERQGDADGAADAWKAVVEDPDAIDRLDSAAVWSAIRADHGGVLKTPYGVLVASRALIEYVLLNARQQYSISGQFQRMQRSIGEIYLGRDAGARYELESAEINPVLSQLKDGFDVALKAATTKIDAIVKEAKDLSKDRGDLRYEVGLDAREVVDEVLADLCETWFGISNGPIFARGGADWLWSEGQPPLYPGHFTALSRYMFQPNPGPTVVELGERYGRALRAAMRGFVNAHRSKGTIPDAPVAKAIFNHSTFGSDNDWVARTMVGVLMGFIAPIIGAVLNVLREWGRDSNFGALRIQLHGQTDASAACKRLVKPMLDAACMRPMPQIIWRTACKSHALGKDNPVQVEKGEKVVLALASGGQESLALGKDGHKLMFGGDRAQTPRHPTHACPGYTAGVAAMLGTLTALLSRHEELHEGSAALSYVIRGPSGLPDTRTTDVGATTFALNNVQRPPALAEALALRANNTFTQELTVSLPTRPESRAGKTILAAGDSWFDYILGDPIDLRQQLKSFGYSFGGGVEEQFCEKTSYSDIEKLRDKKTKIVTVFAKYINKWNIGHPNRPVAILLSGGGNDSVKEKLRSLIVRNDGNPDNSALHAEMLNAHIAKLKGFYIDLLNEIKEKIGEEMPVILHGYDYPLPNGKGLKSWLFDPFFSSGLGYSDTAQADKEKAVLAMRLLIDSLNEMLDDLSHSNEFKAFVKHVDLRGTVEQYWPANPTLGWANDMHPTHDAFYAMAVKIDAAL